MKLCENCLVKVDTNLKFCPLCHSHLLEENEKKTPEKFNNKSKEISKKSPKIVVGKIFFILSVLIIAVSVFINITTHTIAWSVIVGLSILYLWVLVAHTIISRDTPFKKVLYHLIALIALLTSTNLIFGGNDWLTNFVYPGLAMLVSIVLSFILLCSKNRKNMVFSFFSIIFLMTIASAVLLIFKIDAFMLLNQINLMVQAIFIVSYLLFGYKTILSEASRKFHI